MTLDLTMEHYTLDGFYYRDKEDRLHWFNVYPNTHKLIEEWNYSLTANEGYREIKPDNDGLYPITIYKPNGTSKTFWLSFSQLLRLSGFIETWKMEINDDYIHDNAFYPEEYMSLEEYLEIYPEFKEDSWVTDTWGS